jgi:hypothetical protein
MKKKDRDDLKSLLGEGFHCAFRKASSHHLSNRIWLDIRDLPTREWSEVLDFVMLGIAPFVDDLLKQQRITTDGGRGKSNDDRVTVDHSR